MTDSLVLPFINTYMKALVENDSFKQPGFGPGNTRSEFCVRPSTIEEANISIREDLRTGIRRWVTNLNEDRKTLHLSDLHKEQNMCLNPIEGYPLANNKVLKLKTTIHGLIQSPLSFYQLCSEVYQNVGYKQQIR